MIAPYKNPRPHREIALLLDHETVLGESGRESGLAAALAESVQIWGDAGLLRELTRAGHGSAVLWRFVAIGWHPDRTATVWPVRGLQIEQPDDRAETLDGLMRWRDWLESYGAAPAGSLGGSGMSLLKATLTKPLWTAVGDLPPIRYTLGGRQETVQPTPRLIEGELRNCDLAAAYALTLGHARYGGRWDRHDWRGGLWRKVAAKDPHALIYARAVVDIPEMPHELGPLPARPRSQPAAAAQLFWALESDAYPSGRRLQGCWSWGELEAAEAAGCKIARVLDVWAHASLERPFAPWLAGVMQGRELGGFAGRLAKATGNATWGQFAIARGAKRIVARGRDEAVKLRGGNPSQRAFDLAEWISGNVRAQLHRGMMHTAPGLICAHTDGLWTAGELVPGWRHKVSRDADELRLIDAQHLSHRRRVGSSWAPWEYVVAGVLDPGEWFEARWARAEKMGQIAA